MCFKRTGNECLYHGGSKKVFPIKLTFLITYTDRKLTFVLKTEEKRLVKVKILG